VADKEKKSERERKGHRETENEWKCEYVHETVLALTHASVQQKTDRDAEQRHAHIYTCMMYFNLLSISTYKCLGM